jgi:hypothetical protein
MMRSNLVRLALLLTLVFAGCVEPPPPVVVVTRRPIPARPYAMGQPCYGGLYVRGYYDAWGRWHYPHWRCPGGSVIIER